jgi:hypothetical protein
VLVDRYLTEQGVLGVDAVGALAGAAAERAAWSRAPE